MQVQAVSEEKSAVNLRVRTSLKVKAKQLGVNLSKTFERTLEEEIKRIEQVQWQADNQQAIAAYNERIEEHGLALTKYRSF